MPALAVLWAMYYSSRWPHEFVNAVGRCSNAEHPFAFTFPSMLCSCASRFNFLALILLCPKKKNYLSDNSKKGKTVLSQVSNEKNPLRKISHVNHRQIKKYIFLNIDMFFSFSTCSQTHLTLRDVGDN